MRKYKLWQAPILALFSTHFYRYLGNDAKGLGFVYLLAVLAFTCAVPQIKNVILLQEMLASNGSVLAQQLPDITIENGKLSIDRESPVYVTDPKSGICLLAFDTSGENQISPQDVNCLITADSISEHGFSSKFTGIDHFHLGSKQFMHWVNVGTFAIPAATYALWDIPSSWAISILQALGFSLAGLLLAKSISVNIKYSGILRIACFALGNVLIINAIKDISMVQMPTWELYKFGIALVYTLFGVGANLSTPGFQSVSDMASAEEAQR